MPDLHDVYPSDVIAGNHLKIGHGTAGDPGIGVQAAQRAGIGKFPNDDFPIIGNGRQQASVRADREQVDRVAVARQS